MLALVEPVMRPAIDPIAFIVIVIIVFNILSSIFAAAKRGARRASTPPRAAAPRLSPSALPQRSTATISADRAAEIEKIRRALQAAGALPKMDIQVTPTPPVVATATRVTVAATQPPAAPETWSLQIMSPSLMSLESGATAFNQLAGPGGVSQPSAAALTPAAPFRLLQGPAGVMNAFIAAAIVGPCAAFRSPGHTPGGW